MFIKIWALGGIKNYVKDAFNIFDSTLVIISIFDIAIFWGLKLSNKSSDNALSVLTVFRCLRLLRVLKLTSKSENLQTLFKVNLI
jgi:hypothetical protein